MPMIYISPRISQPLQPSSTSDSFQWLNWILVIAVWICFNTPTYLIGAIEEIDLMVLGVIASTKSNKGFALLKDKATGKVLTKQEGAKVGAQKLTIVKVQTRYVTFSLNGEEFQVEVGSDTPRVREQAVAATDSQGVQLDKGIARVGGELHVEANLKEALTTTELPKILMQAAAEPFIEGGQMRGFKLWDIEKGSIFEKAGFRDGDLITHINGIPLKDAVSAIRTLKSLKNAEELDVTYESQGGSGPQNLKIVVQ